MQLPVDVNVTTPDDELTVQAPEAEKLALPLLRVVVVEVDPRDESLFVIEIGCRYLRTTIPDPPAAPVPRPPPPPPPVLALPAEK